LETSERDGTTLGVAGSNKEVRVKFRCERDTLADAVATAQRAVASRTGAMPVLSGLKVSLTGDTLELVGTDLELTIRVRIPADGDGDGTAVVTARLFSELLQKFDAGVVSVEFGDEEARIESGRFTTTLRTLSASEFPRLAEPTTEGGVSVDAHAFGDALRQVISAASRDDARPILTGVLIAAVPEGLRFVATDSYRLGLRDLAGVSVLAEGQKVLVAAKGLGEVQRLLTGSSAVADRKGAAEIEVVLGERDVLFRVGSTEVTTRLIEGEFPNYQQLIPTGYPNRLTVSRDGLQAAVNRVRLVGQNRDSAPIRLAMSAEGLELSAIAQDVGEAHEALEAKYEGADLTVAFNSQFLLDGIDAAASDEVVLESIDPLKPAVMRSPNAEGFLYLLMPVRIS
jgi:DNA polymerase-3 subunit beta